MIQKLLVLFIGMMLLSNAPIIHAEKVPMVTGEWIPFTSFNLTNYGKFTELVNIVFKEMGVGPEYRFYPWQRCYDSVVKGRVFAAFPYSYTKERSKQVMYSDALYCSKTIFIYYDNHNGTKQFKYNNIEDLKKFKIGGVSGYFYENLFQNAGLKVDYTNKEINCLEKLKLGRIDLMPINELVGWHLIRTHFPDDVDKFKNLIKPLSVDTLHLIISKTYPHSKELLKQFNTTLKQCIEKKLIIIPACR